MLPSSKLQQEGVSEGIALSVSVGEGVGTISTIQSPAHPDSSSQLILLRLQYSPPPQVAPPSKLQQDGVVVGIVLGFDEGALTGFGEGKTVGLTLFDGKVDGNEDGAIEGSGDISL